MTQESIFSEREKEVVELLLQGKSNKQIALELGISSRTAEFHLSNIYTKLEVTSRTEAILKLTKDDLRESAGEATTVGLRESTVDKRAKNADNGAIPLSQRRIPMKNFLPIIGAVLITTAITVLVIFANQPAGTGEMSLSVQENTPEIIETPTSISTEVPVQTSVPAYEYLAPHIITNGEMTFEVQTRLSPSLLEFEITATYSEELILGPEYSLFQEVAFIFQGEHSEIILKEFGGGGGGGAGEMKQGSAFKVEPTLEIGQVVYATILVTFDGATGLTEPVSFELAIPVGEPFLLQGGGDG